jgi:HK97 family phage major capsid protein
MTITREDVEILEKAITPGILSGAAKASTVLTLMSRLPNMTTGQEVMRVFDVLPEAYWVNGDSGQKGITRAAWDKVHISAEEVAVIVPISEAVLNDADYDIVGQILPKIQEAFGKVIDEAILFGKNKPMRFRNDIITSARNAGNNVTVPANPNYYDLLMGVGGVISKIEESGYMPNGVVSALTMRARLREIKDGQGRPLYITAMQGLTQYALDGQPLFFPENGAFDSSIASIIVGDWKQAVYSIRQDVTVKLLTEGVIQGADGKILYNLAQQDMVALRVVLRMGWAMPNPASRLDGDRTKCPFAYLEAMAGQTYASQTATITVKYGDRGIKGASVAIGGSKAITDANGTCKFNLNKGTYDMTVTANGCERRSETITVGTTAFSQTVSLAKKNDGAITIGTEVPVKEEPKKDAPTGKK